jgi:CubicO group peptidase (beta-lactamase class C family)
MRYLMSTNLRHIHRLALAGLLLALCLSLPATSSGRGALVMGAVPSIHAAARAPAPGLTDPKELEAFLDEVLARQLAEQRIPGASLAVVKDGRLLFSKGYGYANLEQRTPVVADQTLFRVGSVAKLLTWTAVMQLVELGKLDLHADVNSYLAEFQIPATYPAPITLEHLLTHTAGFEDQQLGITVASEAELVPLGSYLAATMPARVAPPGVVTAYSNYGAALAGYVVERVSGEPFAQYVQRHIFTALAMRRSTFAQLPPAELAAQLAVSYDGFDGSYHALPFEYFQIAPSAALSATATDMAQFMIAHLQDGRLGNARILQAATAQDMHRQHFSNDLRVSGMTYGFAEMTLNGQRLLAHSGTTNDELFRSLLVLVPAQQLGLFVSYSGAGGGDAKWELLQALLDRYYPLAAPAAPDPPAGFALRSSQYVGSYQSTRMAVTSIEKIGALFAPEVAVSATPDGYLTISGLSREPTRWVEIEPLVFRQVGGQEVLAFRADDQGRIAYLFQGNLAISGYRRLGWYEALAFHYGLLGGSVALFLSALLLWPLGWVINGRKRPPQPLAARLARGLGWATSALFMLFLGLLVSDLVDLSRFPTALTTAAMVAALAAAALTAGMAVYAALAWRRGFWGVVGRAHYSLLTIGALAFVWFLSYWNLLGFRW